jgi:membrane associated rhomboid family serine protease
MIPVGDNVRSRTFPFVNVTIIALNIILFLYELTLSTAQLPPFGLSELDRFFFEWGTIPACLVDRLGYETNAPPLEHQFFCRANNEYTAALYSMFLHGGWLHLIGNMVFLWVFGDNVEDAMGHIRYAVFYAAVGLGATAAHVFVNQDDLVPAIGASGAIAGVLAAYLVLYPRATVAAVLPIFILIFVPFYIPAVVLIGFWFFLQIFNGLASFATTDVVNAGGGVAWFAHIGGFVAGLVLVKLFVLGRTVPPVRARRRYAPDD